MKSPIKERKLKSRNSQKQKKSPNRFILYRTHHLKNNPRFNNPDSPVDMRTLSRLISSQWADEPQHVKSYWDNIAARKKLKEECINGEYHNKIDMSISVSRSTTFINSTIHTLTLTNVGDHYHSRSLENCPKSAISNYSDDPFLTTEHSDGFRFLGENFISPDSSLGALPSINDVYLPLPPLFEFERY
ncbi:12610_t:CDS:1 [Gigaspora margarita]|uniref:12610_t:CDS:1 n=1 Tax=Gigaspora margarita TaxID=4874 RepID=A0ABN7UEK4_GIGMA|nr:12610_t:CDS:1 [Gigaspora margarita]